jgi:hypothetical protein
VAIVYHVPSAIPRLNETVNCSGEGGIAKNIGVVSRIDSVQAARFDKPAAFPPSRLAGRRRRGGIENAEAGGNRKHDENPFPAHFSLPLVFRLAPFVMIGRMAVGKRVADA